MQDEEVFKAAPAAMLCNSSSFIRRNNNGYGSTKTWCNLTAGGNTLQETIHYREVGWQYYYKAPYGKEEEELSTCRQAGNILYSIAKGPRMIRAGGDDVLHSNYLIQLTTLQGGQCAPNIRIRKYIAASIPASSMTSSCVYRYTMGIHL